MNELIQVAPRKIGDDSTQTVNARELHAFLEVGKVFAAWIQDRITQYGFVEGRDFALTVSKTGIRQNVIQKDYHLTLDMAKELAMVERNDKGKQARQYFIECERKAKSAAPLIPQSLPEALRLAAQAMEDAERAQAEKLEAESRLRIESEKVGQLSEQVAVAQPKAAALDRIALDCESSFTLRQAAAQLQMQEKAFLAWMHTSGLIYRSESGVWHAYAEPRKRLWLEHKLYPYIDSKDGETRHRTQVRVTARGMAKLAEMLEKVAAACPM